MHKNYRATQQIQRWLFLVAASLAACWVAPSHALVVLQYHHISEDTPKSTSVTPARFAEHMAWLEQQDYRVVAMEQLIAWLDEGAQLPNKAVVITFDDGYTSIYENAWPLLKKKKWPFTVFINTQHHDEKNAQYMSWEQLRELAKNDVSIANHSVNHPHMVRRLADEGEQQWRARVTDEITTAQTIIEKHLGPQPKAFAYPYGEYEQNLQGILAELGYIAFGQQSGPIAPFDSHTALPRFPFGGRYGEKDDFAVKASSQPLPISAAQLLNEKGKALGEPLLPAGVQRPILRLVGPQAVLSKIRCFAGGLQVDMALKDEQLLVQVEKGFAPGRSRYNCTAPASEGFYWYSQLIMKKTEDDRWYSE